MRKVSSLSDYECLCLYKKNKCASKITEHFWMKYQPLVKKILRDYFKFSTSTLEYDDQYQNCFFFMLKALERIKLSKIKNKELFSFGVFFKLYLRSYTRKDFIRESKRLSKTVSNESTVQTEENEYSITDKYMISPDNVEENFLEKEFLQYGFKNAFREFFNNCDKRERKLLNLCIDKNTLIQKDMNYYVDKASKFLRTGRQKTKKDFITRQYMYQSINKLERKFIFHMQKHGYYTNQYLTSVGLTNLVQL